MATSLKVPVTVLIANAEKERRRLIAANKTANERRKEVKDAKLRLAEELEAALRDLRSGKRKPAKGSRYVYAAGHRRDGYYVETLAISVTVDDPKGVKLDTATVDRDLALLRATSQETVSVRLDSDFARYVS